MWVADQNGFDKTYINKSLSQNIKIIVRVSFEKNIQLLLVLCGVEMVSKMFWPSCLFIYLYFGVAHNGFEMD